MTQNGYVCFPRGWMDIPALCCDREPLCKRGAWAWLVEDARWADGDAKISGNITPLKRGETRHSQRFLAKAWLWHESKVRRFLQRLEIDGMITTKTDALSTQITICNYDEICCAKRTSDARPTHDRRTTDADYKKEEGRKKRKSTPLPPSEPEMELFPEPQPAAADDDQDAWEEESAPSKPNPSAQVLKMRAPPGFEEFWAAYPKKADRPRALVAYRQALATGAAPDQIIAGVRRYAFPHFSYASPAYVWLDSAQWVPPPEIFRRPVLMNTML